LVKLFRRREADATKENAMGIFSTIMDKIFNHAKAQPSAQPGASSTATSQPAAQQAQTGAAAQPTSAPAAPAPQPLRDVDVDAVLTQLAATKGGGGNWRTSIVDLLKMLDMDSSLAARKELAQELGVRAGADGSAEQNIALQKAVMKKIAENGGKVPDSLRH
jgi:hypothetical protein